MISVIIPAYNEQERIGDCLDSLAKQHTFEHYEVILVDNNSTDKTVAVAQTFAGKINLRILHEPKKGRGNARRTGWAAACGNILLSTDADSIVPPDWIENFAVLFAKYPHHIAISGNSRVVDCKPMVNRITNTFQPVAAYMVEAVCGYPCLNGFNFGVRSWAYHAAGGFRTDLDAQEDFELSARVAKLGKMFYTQRNSVIMSGRRFRNGLLRGALDYPKTYIQKFWLKKEWVPLEDVR